MFKKKEIPLTRREKIGRVILVEIALLIALSVCLVDLTADYIAKAIYPVQEAVAAKIEPTLTIKEHICKATNGENCDVLYNLLNAENGKLDENAFNHNTNGTNDYSWYQINDVHIIGTKASKGRGTITMPCVYDLYCSTRWVNEKIKKGQLHIWVASSKI